jgi:hypothetical protein
MALKFASLPNHQIWLDLNPDNPCLNYTKIQYYKQLSHRAQININSEPGNKVETQWLVS